MTRESVAIEAKDLRVTRGDKAILRGVSVEARVVGPSGAGKSTLVRALVGVLTAAEGQVLLQGRDVTTWPLWRRAREGIAYVPQTPSVLWDLSVEENLRVYHRVVHGGALARRRPREDALVAALADEVALADRLEVRAGDLSGGERRRLELARALTRRPRVLVCDEPFAGVDPQQAGRIGDLLLRLAHDEGVAVLLADHHVKEALRVCTRALLLLDGEVATESEPEAFQEHPLVVGRYLGSWARSIPPPPGPG